MFWVLPDRLNIVSYTLKVLRNFGYSDSKSHSKTLALSLGDTKKKRKKKADLLLGDIRAKLTFCLA